MNSALLRHTWRSQRAKLAIVSLGLAVWGFLPPVIYARFGSQFAILLKSGIMPAQFARFGGGDVFSLSGSIALSFIHPIAIILTSVFSVGFSAATCTIVWKFEIETVGILCTLSGCFGIPWIPRLSTIVCPLSSPSRGFDPRVKPSLNSFTRDGVALHVSESAASRPFRVFTRYPENSGGTPLSSACG